MKKLFTLAAAGSLVAASLGAQAQKVDGVLNADELSGTSGYQLIGKFTNPRGFGDYGLLSLYVASTPTKVYVFLGGTVETNGNGFQIFMKTPLSDGVPAGTSLPAGTAGTYFEKMTSKLDMATNVAVAFRVEAKNATDVAASTFQLEGASYTSATTATSMKLTTAAAAIPGDGTATTIPTDPGYPALAMAQVAYKSSSDGKILTNPGNTTPNTDAAYGGAGSYGLEIELDRTAAGLVGDAPFTLFAIQNGGDGGYLSSDFIPQTSAPLTANGGNLATGAFDFTALPDTQAATVNLAATGGTTLGTKASSALVGLGVYPNPVAGVSTISYRVAGASAPVRIELQDMLGRTVRVLENGLKAGGSQTKSIASGDAAAGIYFVRVQVGDNVATSKVVLQ